MMDVCLLGTGGTVPLLNRWLTSAYIRINGRCILIDCGEGTQIAAAEAKLSLNPIDIICITHFHADHTAGLPGLLLSMAGMERKDPVTIIGPNGIKQVVEALTIIAPEIPFKIEYTELNTKSSIHFSNFDITAFPVEHTCSCYGYCINLKRKGKFLPENAQRLCIPKRLWGKLQNGLSVEADEHTYTPDMVMEPDRRGIKLTYCTDTRPCKELTDNAKDSDLLICEGMYSNSDNIGKAIAKKHMLFREAAETALGANVKELWLTHFSPSETSPSEAADEAEHIFKNTRVGEDGMRTTLRFDK